MPLIKLQVATSVPPDKKEALLAAACKIVAEATGKPPDYVMAVLEDDAIASLGGVMCPAAFADVRGIGGIDGSTNAAISKEICALLQEELSERRPRCFGFYYILSRGIHISFRGGLLDRVPVSDRLETREEMQRLLYQR